MTSINSCQALETAVRDARAEIGVNSKMRRTISGGRMARGSATGEMPVIFETATVFFCRSMKVAGAGESVMV